MRKAKSKTVAKRAKSKFAAGTIGHRVLKTYVDKNGVECIEIECDDGLRMTLKIHNPNHPFWEERRRNLADMPPLNIDEAISELRDENF